MDLWILNLQMHLFHHQHIFFQINKIHLGFLFVFFFFPESAWFRILITFLCVEKCYYSFASEWEDLLVSNLVFLPDWKQHLGILQCFLGRSLMTEALEVSLRPLFLFSLSFTLLFFSWHWQFNYVLQWFYSVCIPIGSFSLSIWR